MTQIFHRKSGSNARAQSVDAANPSSINGGDDHRPNVTSSKRNSITNVKGNLKSLFNSSAPSNPSLIKTSSPANLPPSSFHPSHPSSDSVPPPSNDQSVAIGAYSVEEGSSEPAAVPSVEWVPPLLPTAYVNRTLSAEGPLGERLEEGQKSRPDIKSPATGVLIDSGYGESSASTATMSGPDPPLSFDLPQSTAEPAPATSPDRPLIDLSSLPPALPPLGLNTNTTPTASTPLSRRTQVQVPSILSPNLSSYSFGTPASSYFPTGTAPTSSSPFALSRNPSSNAFFTPSAGLAPNGAPTRPNFSARKSSVSALPRPTPTPMPIANLPTLSPSNVTSPTRPENPRKAVRDMPKVFMAHGPVEEEDDGGDAGDGSDSSSDESDTDSEEVHPTASGSGGVTNGHVKGASASSVSVDSIIEEGNEAEGSSRFGAASPTTPPEQTTSLADRRHIAAPHLSLSTPPSAISSNSVYNPMFANSQSTANRFDASSWSLSTPSAESAKTVGSWATFSMPTPGITPGATRNPRSRPSSAASSTGAKTPGLLEKGRTPRARSTTGGSENGYFDLREGGPTEGGKTPTPLSLKGKGRMGVPTMSMGAPSDAGDVGRIPLDEDSGMETTTETDEQTTDSEAEQHSPASSPEVEEPRQHNPHSPRAASTPDASSRAADSSFVMVDPPTPGASSLLRPQESFRPSLYHQASRSLVNLSSASDRRMDQEREQERASFRDRMNAAASPGLSLGDLPKPIVESQSDVFGGSGDVTEGGGDASGLRSPPPLFSPSIHSVTPKPFIASISTTSTAKAPSSHPSPSGTPTATRHRRRSMTDATHISPPEYSLPAFNSGIPRPRDEEGKEGLPAYGCSVHIEGYLPRKMEFSSPGVQARDRAWKRQYFVLHGTCLKVYKHDIRKSPVRTGSREYAGDTLSDVDGNSAHVHFPGVPSVTDSRPPPSASASSHTIGTGSGSSLNIAQQAARRGSNDTDTSLGPASRRGSVASAVASAAVGSRRGSVDLTALGGGSARRGSADLGRARAASVSSNPNDPNSSTNSSSSSLGNSSTSSALTEPDPEKALFDPSTSSGLLAVPSHASPYSGSSGTSGGPKLPFHGPNALVKTYTLQNAESGLAADYLKKKNVVRVRLMGEQFLLQADSPKDVVDWIEAFQAGTNVSMDLDDRQMPKIITLPRRRRRRPGPTASGPAAPGDALPSSVEDTAEANIRAAAAIDPSILGDMRAGGGSAVDAMERMLGEDQQSGVSSTV